MPITEHKEIVMIRQYRHGSRRVTLEIPGGMVDVGEAPSTAAVRECHEETGYVVKKPLSLGEVNPNTALFTNTLHTFYGHICDYKPIVNHSETEKTEVELIPFNDVRSLLLEGTIDHALVCATLWRFLDRCQQKEGSAE